MVIQAVSMLMPPVLVSAIVYWFIVNLFLL